jgi:hypothetical protein
MRVFQAGPFGSSVGVAISGVSTRPDAPARRSPTVTFDHFPWLEQPKVFEEWAPKILAALAVPARTERPAKYNGLVLIAVAWTRASSSA